MRADRLLALLLLLQSRGRMTAAALAEDLQVSERTIYRDMEALSMAGVPVYAERGPGGGCCLLEGYRTDLTGLTADEISALAVLPTSPALDQLGIGNALRQALLKLLAARASTTGADSRLRVYIDPEPWNARDEPGAPLLQTVYAAVMAEQCLQVSRPGPRGMPIWLSVHPYGLVAKQGRWYLLAGMEAHTLVLRLDHLIAARPLDHKAIIPPDFDLQSRWERSWRTLMADRPHYDVTLRVHTSLAWYLSQQYPALARDIATAQAQTDDGWFELELTFGSLIEARARILGWGAAAEVLRPEPLRQSVADFCRQAAALYDSH